MISLSLILLISVQTDDFGGALGVEAVEESDADADLFGLAVRVFATMRSPKALKPRILALIRLRAWHPVMCLRTRPAGVSWGAQGFVSGPCGRTVFLAGPPVLADRDDCAGLTRNDGGVAAADVTGAVRSHSAAFFALRDLLGQLRQDRTVPYPAVFVLEP
tara:strand:- start:468 stop:950 length:483 start_codon:yes stop_codon:yes gene_type:complete